MISYAPQKPGGSLKGQLRRSQFGQTDEPFLKHTPLLPNHIGVCKILLVYTSNWTHCLPFHLQPVFQFLSPSKICNRMHITAYSHINLTADRARLLQWISWELAVWVGHCGNAFHYLKLLSKPPSLQNKLFKKKKNLNKMATLKKAWSHFSLRSQVWICFQGRVLGYTCRWHNLWSVL